MTVETFAWFGNSDDAVRADGSVRRRAILLPGGAASVDSPPLFHVAQVLAGTPVSRAPRHATSRRSVCTRSPGAITVCRSVVTGGSR